MHPPGSPSGISTWTEAVGSRSSGVRGIPHTTNSLPRDAFLRIALDSPTGGDRADLATGRAARPRETFACVCCKSLTLRVLKWVATALNHRVIEEGPTFSG